MNLTIIDSKSHEPLLVLSEDDKGISVVGGDPKMVQALGLQRFSSLKEISDYINSAESDVQAILDDQKDNQKPQENPDMDARIKPALDLIRNLMSKVNDRKRRDKVEENQKNPETALQNTSESEMIINPLDKIYVSIDGDNIGNAVARAEEQDDEAALTAISNRINAGQDVLRDWAIRMNGVVIEQGGDEGVVKVPATALKDIESLRELYRQAVGATASVGVGKKISESTKARMLAKLKGKNRTIVFDSSTAQELELRLKDSDTTEANKLRIAMRPDQDVNQENPESPRSIEPDTSAAQAPQEQQEPDQAQPRQDVAEIPYQGNALQDAKRLEVQQKGEEKKPKVQKREDQASVGSIDEDLVKHMLNTKPKETGSAYGDSEIDNMDFSEHDSPEFAKAAHYLVKHGGRK